MQIDEQKLNEMFLIAGIRKKDLHESLVKLGKKNLKTKQQKDMWSEDRPTTQYCYVVAEFLWYYVAPWGSVSYSVRVPGDPGLHRYIMWPGGKVVDLACDQFDNYEELDYTKSKQTYFMQSGGKGPSKRAQLLATYMDYDFRLWKDARDLKWQSKESR